MIKQNQHFIINQSNLLWPENFNTSYQSSQAWYWDKWIKMKKKTKIRQYLFRSIRSSHRRCFIKKVFFEISQNSQENTCDRVSRQQFYLKRGSRAGVFLWILRNLSEHLFHRTSPDDCSCSIKTWAIARKSNPKRSFCGVKSLWK